MKIAETVLCIGCDEVYSWREHRSCPSCGSKVSMHLSRLVRPMEARVGPIEMEVVDEELGE